jgi:hypothetical protein
LLKKSNSTANPSSGHKGKEDETRPKAFDKAVRGPSAACRGDQGRWSMLSSRCGPGAPEMLAYLGYPPDEPLRASTKGPLLEHSSSAPAMTDGFTFSKSPGGVVRYPSSAGTGDRDHRGARGGHFRDGRGPWRNWVTVEERGTKRSEAG